MGWDQNFEILSGAISAHDLGVAAHYPNEPNNVNWLIANGIFNIWARDKAFRNPTIGFAYDKNQSTPDLRSPTRIAAALAAYWGMNIPRYGLNDFKTHYADAWSWLRPRGKGNGPGGTDEIFRVQDFDGYANNCWWQLGPLGSAGVYTIFNGFFDAPNVTVGAGDNLRMNIQCKENAEIDNLGLLYPYNFAGAPNQYDLSLYYLGIAILDSSNVLWIKTGDRMNAFSPSNPYASLIVQIPNNVANGAIKAMPVLTEQQSLNSDWDTGLNGWIVSLNGAYLSLTKSSEPFNIRTTAVFYVTSSNVRVVLTIQNTSGNPITVNNMYGYLMSEAAYNNEADSGYNAPDYVAPGAFGYIVNSWPQNYKQGDIYLSDWTGQAQSPDYLGARAYNLYSPFYSANNNSNVLGGYGSVSFEINFPYTDDGWGAYSNGVRLAWCLALSNGSFVRDLHN